MQKYCDFFSKVWGGIHSNMHTPRKLYNMTPQRGSLKCAFNLMSPCAYIINNDWESQMHVHECSKLCIKNGNDF
jgi:hypothetical protein